MAQQQRIARNTLLAIIGVAAAGLVRFGFALVTGRAFGTEALGAVAVVVAVATITTIPAAGIGAAGNRFIALSTGAGNDSMRRDTLGAMWRGSLISIVVAAAVSGAYLAIVGDELLDPTTITIGVLFVTAYGMYLTAKGALFGDGRAERYAIGEVVGITLFGLSLAVIVSSSLSPGWVIASQVFWALGVVVMAVSVGLGPRSLRGTAPKDLWSFSATSTAGSLLSLGLTQATVLVIAAVHGNVQAGLLAAAVAVTAPLYLLPRGLSLALTPSMSFHVGAGSQVRANLDTRYTTALLVMFGGLSAITIIAFRTLILSIYGGEFADAATFVTVFAIASFAAIVGIPVVNRFASQGSRPLFVTVAASATGAVAALVLWVTLGRTDPTWIAIGFLVATVIKVSIPFAMSKRVIGTWLTPPGWLIALTVVLVAMSTLGEPWNWLSLGLAITSSVPIVFVATVRYRSAASAARPPDKLILGVLTNAYPMQGHQHYGVFVRNRVTEYERQGVVVVLVAPRRKSGLLKYVLLTTDALWSLIRDPIPDVYECHPVRPTGIINRLVAEIAQRPYILYAHGADVETDISQRIYLRLTTSAIAHAAEIHTNSDATRATIETRWPTSPRVHVIPPGVPMHDERSPVVRDLDILYVGNLIHRKGVDVLISAVSMLPTPARLTVVGDGPERSRLAEQASREGVDAEFLGSAPPADIPALMGRAKIVVVPSRDEPLGQVAVEALAAGTPVVVSDTGGLASIPTVEVGAVVATDNPGALADAIETWIGKELTTAASTAARQRALLYSVTPMAAEAIDRFSAVARRDSTRSGA